MIPAVKASLFVLSFTFVLLSSAYRYDPAYIQFNLNQNQYAEDPLDYWGEWSGHEYTPSPENWRFPFYTIFLDRFVNGDPFNDNINGTTFEHDLNSNQMRHGGDLAGLVDTLDYIEGMGIKGLYLAGSPFINSAWGYDQYSPLDLSILEPHFGTIDWWRYAIEEIHARGMYVVLDNTFATLGDLIGFDGYLNTTTPFTLKEHNVMWKSDRHYWDFSFGNTYNQTCNYPRFWNETGFPIDADIKDQMVGCFDSDFDQYGDTEAFGVYPDWRRELSKFASVQDRLREWHPSVRAKLENFYCMAVAQLDIDGFRYDKATQSTVDAMGEMSAAMRSCAKRFGKENFFLPGEITGGNTFGSIFVGRGRQPDMLPDNITQAVSLTNHSADEYFLREPENVALDGAAFHYTVYRTLTRFLGMDGNLAAGYDAPLNWVDQWNTFLWTNDLVNANTGKFDPRHMYGVTNQDVFRWPAVTNGVERQLLGHFITNLLMPGIPLLLWGEEQSFYVLDNTDINYMFGRQAFSSATAWQTHGCYSIGSAQYYQMPLDSARDGCNDDTVGYDHRDPSAPVRNILRRMFQLREAYPIFNDGFFLQQLSNMTTNLYYPGSSGIATETGLWSVMRSGYPGLQNLTRPGMPDTPIWLIYSNWNTSQLYQFDCYNNATDMNTTALLAPYSGGTIVKNLFYPYDEQLLGDSAHYLGINGSTLPNGCLSSLKTEAYDFRAYVPYEIWVGPQPMITKFSPGHDARILSKVNANETEDVDIEIQFSTEMDCDSVTHSVTFSSKTETGMLPRLNYTSVKCHQLDSVPMSPLVGAIHSTWSWSATINHVANGIHTVSVNSPNDKQGNMSTGSRDHFFFRIGQSNNPMVYPRSANYSTTLLTQADNGNLVLHHSAAGADLYRYSTNFASSFSGWLPYKGGVHEIEKQPWSGTELQKWDGEHVRVEYYSRMTGSSDYVQQADLGTKPRRFPHIFLNGPYNSYGYDAGLENHFDLTADHEWQRHWMVEWSLNGSVAQFNVWGMNPDGNPDAGWVYGDADGDSVLDRLPPSALAPVILNITAPPPKPHLSWRIVINDGNLRLRLVPAGNMWLQLTIYVLLWVIPLATGAFSVWAYLQSFYKIKFNEIGVSEKKGLLSGAVAVVKKRFGKSDKVTVFTEGKVTLFDRFKRQSGKFIKKTGALVNAVQGPRRTVLIGTMEYDIEDWNIKIKIGGLGVMSSLMGKNLGHQDLIWVVPCVGGVDYPTDERAEPMNVVIMGISYEVSVQYHRLRNITYVLLDAPIFRQQTKAEPYPARMDDMTSAIYYSAWNQCIAQALDRFNPDLYHINDYHGTVAPLHLLPKTIPVCLSLHNAEFQGLWPMRNKEESEEVCSVFNLDPAVAKEYVQFGEVFNLLHAGASYLRVHQQGFGAVGVSKKYGARAYARYPIFWGLKEVQSLQNPDPSDTGEWDKKLPREEDMKVDDVFEVERLEHRVQAQEWAGLEQDRTAELFVFVGRWSMQKGVDLIADVFPAILEANPKAQLICIGPVIDLHGKFAALKLEKMMKMYPTRVCSKPVFTALPPYVFSGAEFALIPSRDEPFGLVAVEFGRKGALGVGARVGGLGQMPGWWYTVESTTTQHVLNQFKEAIHEAMDSSIKTRAMMRARSAKQRFPVAQWVEDLEILQSTSIRTFNKVKNEKKRFSTATLVNRLSTVSLPNRFSSANLGRSSLLKQGSQGLPQGPGHVYREDRADSRESQLFDVGQYLIPELADLDVNGFGRSLSQYVESYEEDRYRDHSDDEFDDDDASLFFGEADLASPAVASPIGPLTPQEEGGADYFDAARAVSLRVVSSGDIKRLRPFAELSVDSVVGKKDDFNLQQVDPFFTDSSGHYYRVFEKKLDDLNGKNSESSHCIEEYLVKSEKEWFDNFRSAKLGRQLKRESDSFFSKESRPVSIAPSEPETATDWLSLNEEFSLGENYKPPRGLRNWMQIRILSWPLYAYFMALGQIMAANSYQIVLLTGEVGETKTKLYAIASIYLGTSMCWWYMYRRFASFISLSLPFFFYGTAFLMIGLARLGNPYTTGWIYNIATGFYTLASSSGALFFSLNFGDEGGAQVRAWVFRACVIQGSQQIYVVALWLWGSVLTKEVKQGVITTAYTSGTGLANWKIMAVAFPLTIFLWALGFIMFFGLPSYYRQAPGRMPSFYKSIARRKVVLWFFLTAIVQNYFLSAPYGRNWTFLFSSVHAETWQVLVLVVIFFIGIWAGLLWIFGYLSMSHSWILPLFAIGLGAPRWAQIWWGTSNIGLYLPWAGSFVWGALFSRALWLWLGVLDAIQGVGIGMIMLGTLTRTHVAFAVTASQILGSAATIAARATAPNRIGPGPISPDVSGSVHTIWQAWFWVGLAANLLLCVGFYKFYRKEQLQKP